jgi:hypothetical protein
MRVDAEELAVGHVAEPGDRMPVGVVKGREGPADAVDRQAALHQGVAGDVLWIVEHDKVVNRDRHVDGRDGDQQHRAEAKREGIVVHGYRAR